MRASTIANGIPTIAATSVAAIDDSNESRSASTTTSEANRPPRSDHGVLTSRPIIGTATIARPAAPAT